MLSDQLIALGRGNSKETPNSLVPLDVIDAKPQKSKCRLGPGSAGQNCDDSLRIVTNLVALPAEIIALLYH